MGEITKGRLTMEPSGKQEERKTKKRGGEDRYSKNWGELE
jgi:hypothetical protein